MKRLVTLSAILALFVLASLVFPASVSAGTQYATIVQFRTCNCYPSNPYVGQKVGVVIAHKRYTTIISSSDILWNGSVWIAIFECGVRNFGVGEWEFQAYTDCNQSCQVYSDWSGWVPIDCVPCNPPPCPLPKLDVCAHQGNPC